MSALAAAAASGNVSFVTTPLPSGADTRLLCGPTGRCGRPPRAGPPAVAHSPLHMAAAAANGAAVTAVVDAGADPSLDAVEPPDAAGRAADGGGWAPASSTPPPPPPPPPPTAAVTPVAGGRRADTPLHAAAGGTDGHRLGARRAVAVTVRARLRGWADVAAGRPTGGAVAAAAAAAAGHTATAAGLVLAAAAVAASALPAAVSGGRRRSLSRGGGGGPRGSAHRLLVPLVSGGHPRGSAASQHPAASPSSPLLRRAFQYPGTMPRGALMGVGGGASWSYAEGGQRHGWLDSQSRGG